LLAANDSPIQSLGSVETDILLNGNHLRATFLITNEVNMTILGREFLYGHVSGWDFGTSTLTVDGRQMKLVPFSHQKLRCYKVGVTRARAPGTPPSRPSRWQGGIPKKLPIIDRGADQVKQPIPALMELEVQPTREFVHLISAWSAPENRDKLAKSEASYFSSAISSPYGSGPPTSQ